MSLLISLIDLKANFCFLSVNRCCSTGKLLKILIFNPFILECADQEGRSLNQVGSTSTGSLLAQKSLLRREIKLRLAALDSEALAASSTQICQSLSAFLATPDLKGCTTILGWHSSFVGEVSLANLFDRLLVEKLIYLPRTSNSGELEFIRIDQDWRTNLQRGLGGAWEPGRGEMLQADLNSPAVLLLPGLAFDLLGMRLGRGKGCYDRFLANWKGAPALKIAVCLDCQIVKEVPTACHDQQVDYICTESGIRAKAGGSVGGVV